MMEHSYRIILFKNDCLKNEMINSLTLHMEVFKYNVYRDEQVDSLVVDCSLNLVNHYDHLIDQMPTHIILPLLHVSALFIA